MENKISFCGEGTSTFTVMIGTPVPSLFSSKMMCVRVKKEEKRRNMCSDCVYKLCW